MARYTGPVCRLCRREGIKLFLKGTRCYSGKCAIDRRSYAPGQHGQGRKKATEYGLQLREKQKARRIYGVLERQFRLYFAKAAREKGVTGERLLQLLELRLDNVVTRAGFADSRSQGRQLVRHGHFTVNGHRVNIPSYLVKEGDVIVVATKSLSIPLFQEYAESMRGRRVVPWISVELNAARATIVGLPKREDIDIPVREHLIVERYSR
ncbi:MAG: 30S ribosomal protein S4 [Firmicutes bacterium]|nr:30S ribosomal protein S4 [candidate division NPL-UPA2 bacterium]MBT9153557.1 30S ribosomal protein S4 [candidate division NPL-UPA2 bacterium]MBT9155256.1 30S ribosomal protein S4 [candidate division NPL-UPA2 bacterium]